jgi:hypothetical protein
VISREMQFQAVGGTRAVPCHHAGVICAEMKCSQPGQTHHEQDSVRVAMATP